MSNVEWKFCDTGGCTFWRIDGAKKTQITFAEYRAVIDKQRAQRATKSINESSNQKG